MSTGGWELPDVSPCITNWRHYNTDNVSLIGCNVEQEHSGGNAACNLRVIARRRGANNEPTTAAPMRPTHLDGLHGGPRRVPV